MTTWQRTTLHGHAGHSSKCTVVGLRQRWANLFGLTKVVSQLYNKGKPSN